MRLLNGKELKDALKEVAVYKDKSKALMDKYGYYQKSEYYERLCQVFGIDGFKPDYDFKGLEVLPTGQIFGTAKCTIYILGEDGSIVYSVSGIGTDEIKFSEDNGKYLSLNNVGSGIDTAAFKEACRQMNMFNCVLEKKSGNDSNNESGYSRASVEVKTFNPSGRLTEVGKGGRDNKAIYKQKGKLDGVETELIFYHNNYSKDPSWERYFAALGNFSQTVVNCEKSRNGTGYIFKSFVKKEG